MLQFAGHLHDFENVLAAASRDAGRRPASGIYARDPQARVLYAAGLPALTLADDRICAMTRFDSSMLTWSGLPRTLGD